MQIRLCSILVCFLLVGMTKNALATLTLVGSDLLAGPVAAAIEAELTASGFQPQMELNGSLPGRLTLEAGQADASLLVIPDGVNVPAAYRSFPVAFQITALLVHESNPVTELSFAQLARLFGTDNPVENWSELTPGSGWAGRKVELMADRQANMVALELLNQNVLAGASFTNAIEPTAAFGTPLYESIRLNPNLMIVVPFIQPPSGGRLLDIKVGDGDQSYNPSPANIYYGDYPLRLPIYLVVSDRLPADTTKKLLQVLLSPSVTKALLESHFVPLPDQEKRELLSRLD